MLAKIKPIILKWYHCGMA